MKLKQNEAFPGPKVGPQTPGGGVPHLRAFLSNADLPWHRAGSLSEADHCLLATGETRLRGVGL